MATAAGDDSHALSAPSPSLPEVAADPREKLLARGLRMLLEQEHLEQKTIDDDVSKKAFIEYIDALDAGKLFLLATQIEQLRVYSSKMDDQLRAGDFELGRVGAAMLAARQKAVGMTVAELLAKPFDYELEEYLETDDDKLGFSKSDRELRDRWRKVLKLQVMERVARMDDIMKARAKLKKGDEKAKDPIARSLKEIPRTFDAREKKAREDLARTYDGRFSRLAKIESLEPSETFLNALATIYDPHTIYMAPAEKDNFDIQMSGSLEGIGAVLSEDDHYISVREIVPGGASWRQGQLKAGDLILAVTQEAKDPVDVADMRINQVVKMIRGPKGSVVTLTVKKPDDRMENISITRDVIEIEAAYARGAVLEGKTKGSVGYIALPSFYGNTRARPGKTPERDSSADLRRLLSEMRKLNLRGVILDLRGNGGGLLEHARVITGLFIDTGPVVQTRSPSEGSNVLSDDDPGMAFDGPLVVMVDRFSASASEIVAGALKDYGRAIIVGTGPTHGKGTVQMLLDLNRLGGKPGQPLGVLKLTIQQFFRVNGSSTQWKGVEPDIKLPDPAAHIESGERYLDNAIKWTEVKPLSYQRWQEAPSDMGSLRAKSKERQAANAVFSKISKRTDFLKRRSENTRVPLMHSRWLERRERDRKALEAANPKLDKGSARLKVKVVRYAPKKTADPKAESDRLKNWKKRLSRDPWVEEARNVLLDSSPP